MADLGIFTARFRSRCACGCDKPIEPGHQARASGHGGWLHADCGDPPEPAAQPKPRPDRPVCDRCWLVPASSGVCGCDS